MTIPFARTPDECDRMFAEFVSAGHLDGLVGLYEPGAQYIERDGTVRCGPEEIRRVLARLTGSPTTLTCASCGSLKLVQSPSCTTTGPCERRWAARSFSGQGRPSRSCAGARMVAGCSRLMIHSVEIYYLGNAAHG